MTYSFSNGNIAVIFDFLPLAQIYQLSHVGLFNFVVFLLFWFFLIEIWLLIWRFAFLVCWLYILILQVILSLIWHEVVLLFFFATFWAIHAFHSWCASLLFLADIKVILILNTLSVKIWKWETNKAHVDHANIADEIQIIYCDFMCMIEYRILKVNYFVVVANRCKDIKRDQKDVNHDARECCDLDEQSHLNSFMRIRIVLQKCVIEYYDALNQDDKIDEKGVLTNIPQSCTIQ
jgi:hypothetical protein